MSADIDFPWLSRTVFSVTPRLPNELFLMVVSFCDDAATLIALGQCNKDVHSIAIPKLYRSIDIPFYTLDALGYGIVHSDPNIRHFSNAGKWRKYKLACCALVKQARVVGPYEAGRPLKLRLLSQTLGSDDFHPLFPNLTNLCLYDSTPAALGECLRLAKAQHVCYNETHPPPPTGRSYRFPRAAKHTFGRYLPETLTLHRDVSMPISHPNDLTVRYFARNVGPDVDTVNILWRWFSESCYDPDHDPGQPAGISPPRPRSLEIIGIRRPRKRQVLGMPSFPNLFWILLNNVHFTKVGDAQPCALCGEK